MERSSTRSLTKMVKKRIPNELPWGTPEENRSSTGKDLPTQTLNDFLSEMIWKETIVYSRTFDFVYCIMVHAIGRFGEIYQADTKWTFSEKERKVNIVCCMRMYKIWDSGTPITKSGLARIYNVSHLEVVRYDIENVSLVWKDLGPAWKKNEVLVSPLRPIVEKVSASVIHCH